MGQQSTLWAQVQQNWWPQTRAAFLGSVRQIAQLGTLTSPAPTVLLSAAVQITIVNKDLYCYNMYSDQNLIQQHINALSYNSWSI